jgi:hypothetical protein
LPLFLNLFPLSPLPKLRGDFAKKQVKLSERSEFLSGCKSTALWRGLAVAQSAKLGKEIKDILSVARAHKDSLYTGRFNHQKP